jgi:FkbH-like protein
VIVFALSPDDALRASKVDADSSAGDVVSELVEELASLWKIAQDTFGATPIQQTFLDVAEPLFGHFDHRVAAAPATVVDRINELTRAASVAHGVLLLDIARCAARDGRDAWFDITHWHASKLMIAPQVAPMYGEQLMRIVAANMGLARKCLVLDLDNTLWGGVIGDDGIQGLVLGQGSAQGEAHLALQAYARQLRDRGIILAVCSKNERATAEEVFTSHPDMLLRMDDIAAFVANWEDKAENLKSIASMLNIGLDSLVFVDDNPAERGRIRGALPQVGVPELPEDPAGYVRCIAAAGYFEAVSFTREDVQRSSQYAANARREALRENTQSLEEFRRDLQMSLVVDHFSPVDIPRVAQLINKTNQFNLSGRRYTQHEVEAIAGDAGCLTLQFRLSDRFGENGLISAVICRAGPEGAMDIDTWVMSCRVFGREVEFEIINAVTACAAARGFRALRLSHVRTPKNGLLTELIPRLGFVADHSCTPTPDTTHWVLPLENFSHHKTQINTELSHHDK